MMSDSEWKELERGYSGVAIRAALPEPTDGTVLGAALAEAIASRFGEEYRVHLIGGMGTIDRTKGNWTASDSRLLRAALTKAGAISATVVTGRGQPGTAGTRQA